jgi:hypothetical protein
MVAGRPGTDSLGKETPMKLLFAALIAAAGASTCCFAQDQSGSKPPILLESKKEPSALTNENCVDVEIGGDKAPSLGCLNRKLKQQVDTVQPSLNSSPLDAKSPDARIGIANEAAARQQFGSSFGRSIVPPRPPTPVFQNPQFGRR